ncbi:hypothetical protein SLA2020_332280 [Shorea laevis]
MGARKIFASAPASIGKALSPFSSSSQSAALTGKPSASSSYASNASAPATSNTKSFVPNPHSLHHFLTKRYKCGVLNYSG